MNPSRNTRSRTRTSPRTRTNPRIRTSPRTRTTTRTRISTPNSNSNPNPNPNPNPSISGNHTMQARIRVRRGEPVIYPDEFDVEHVMAHMPSMTTLARMRPSTMRLMTVPLGNQMNVRLRISLEVDNAGGSQRRQRGPGREMGEWEEHDESRMTSEMLDSDLRARRRPSCNHVYDRNFCSKCHIRRRHLCRWWWRQQYRQH